MHTSHTHSFYDLKLNDLNHYLNINKKQIIQLSDENNLVEVAGFYLKDGTITELENLADDPTTSFTFAPNMWEWAENNRSAIAGIWHSHPSEYQAGKLSWGDILLSHTRKLPICVYHPVFKVWDFYSPNIPHPYPLMLVNDGGYVVNSINDDWWLGWVYEPGRADCYSLINYYYQAHYKTTLKIPSRNDRDYGDRASQWNRFFDESGDNGFVLREGKPQIGDVVLMRLAGAKNPNHIGVLGVSNQGKNSNGSNGSNGLDVLHLMGGKRKSEYTPLNHLRNVICGVMRYVG